MFLSQKLIYVWFNIDLITGKILIDWICEESANISEFAKKGKKATMYHNSCKELYVWFGLNMFLFKYSGHFLFIGTIPLFCYFVLVALQLRW